MATTTWSLDPTHSELQFKVKHLMISTVTGSFKDFSGTIETDGDDFTTGKIHVAAEVLSVSTNNEQRDGHLKGGDFFDAATYPQVTFDGTKFTKVDDENYTLDGTLTLRGVSKPVSLKVSFGGIAKDGYGNTRAGFEVNGKINRDDFGMEFSMATEAGGLVIGKEITVMGNVQFIRQAAAVTA